jgi:hypothetical protein
VTRFALRYSPRLRRAHLERQGHRRAHRLHRRSLQGRAAHRLQVRPYQYIEAARVGTIADAKDRTFTDTALTIEDNSAVKITDSTNVTGLPTATTAPAAPPLPTAN